jgi:hypothetical protein
MSNTSKKIVSIIGIVIGVIIIIIGFSLQDTSNYSIGKSIKFGADFYTEMYDVTKDVGRAINYAINDLICAISWLIISLGAIDICFFVYKLVKASEVSAIEVNAKVQAEEKLKCEANEKNKRETEERLKRESIERNRREAMMRKEPLLTKPILPMDKPKGFQPDLDWETNISSLSNHEIYTRYIDEAEWSEEYRYHCYLELNKRGVQSIQIASQYNAEEQNELKILPNGRGYVCPLCGFSNSSFSACAQCKYSPFENISEQTPATDDEYIDITCPKCGELLSFFKGETNGLCPECGAEFEI